MYKIIYTPRDAKYKNNASHRARRRFYIVPSTIIRDNLVARRKRDAIKKKKDEKCPRRRICNSDARESEYAKDVAAVGMCLPR